MIICPMCGRKTPENRWNPATDSCVRCVAENQKIGWQTATKTRTVAATAPVKPNTYVESARVGDDVALFGRRAGALLAMADNAESEGRHDDAESYFSRGQEYLMKARRAERIDHAKQVGQQGAAMIGWLVIAACAFGIVMLLSFAG